MGKLARAPAFAARARRTLKQVGPVRTASAILFLSVALLLARYAWSIPFLADAERALYDWRLYQTAPRVEQDKRILLLVYTDETLEALSKRSPLDRRMLANALAAVDRMRPKAIGVDILIDQAQAEDPLLLQALRSMRAPTYLAFASNLHNPESIQLWQERFLTRFLQSAAPDRVRPGSVRLQVDSDNVIRSWPGQLQGLPPALSYALAPQNNAFASYSRSIAFRLPKSEEYPVFSKLPIELLAGDMAAAFEDQIKGRYVFIGADVMSLDDYDTPLSKVTGAPMKGVEVHAHMLAQVLDNRLPNPVPQWALWIAAIGVIVAGSLTSLLDAKGWRLALILTAQILFFVLLAFHLQSSNVDTQGLPSFGWGLGWTLAFAAVGTAARAIGSEERRFAQTALGKYLPPDIAAEILRDPEQLSLHGEKKEIYALFTDLEGFTKLSHAIPPELLSKLLNRYLDTLSDIVLQHGGTIDKFVGDAVVAFWGAPIARADDADRAMQAATAMCHAGEAFARSGDAQLPPVGITRVGLHRGQAVVGNFGGRGRMQYTALGDGMNTAARLESANKALKTKVLVSAQAKEASTLDIFRPMGRIVLSGRSTPVEVWEPVPNMDAGVRQRLTALWQAYDGGEIEAAASLREIMEAHPDDVALARFVYRIEEAGPGGSNVLESK